MKVMLAAAAAVVGVLALPSGAFAALDLRLHPVGQGKDTHAFWVGGIGEADNTGAANQAFRLTNGDTDANGSAAIIRGIEDVPVNYMTSLSYEYRKDGRCSKTDPRWTLFVQGKSGRQYVVNVGCAEAAPSTGSTPGWIRRTATQPFLRMEVLRKAGTDALAGRLTGLALAYDQTVGSILVDNITVASKLGKQTWTSAADNGNDPSGPDGFTDEQAALLALPFSIDELTYVDDLLASATPDEWAAIQEDADPAP
jgi:hypothetical protein